MSTSSAVISDDPFDTRAGELTAREVSLPAVPLSWFQSITRSRMLGWLAELEGGQITVQDLRETKTYGPAHHAGGQSFERLQARWRVNDRQFYSLLGSGGSLGVAESYMRGQWKTDDLTSLIRILCRNLHRMSNAYSAPASVVNWLRAMAKPFQRNTRSESKRQIAAHYDLSNEFFELFLDPTMMYSAGYFEHHEVTMEQASIAKLERICAKLKLESSDRVLEIGTGWGGFALHAASRHGVQLTTTTISDAQHTRASERIFDAGLADQIELLNADYRDLEGQFDKIVSIEMVEAVGERSLDAYFRQCGRLLRPGGRLVLQAIVMPEQRYEAYRKGTDFIQKYIFPGGFLPSVTAMQGAIGRVTDLRLAELEDISSHYARTLQCWRERFFAHLDQVRDLGFDERFIRMWEYYLCYCEAAFREQSVKVVQIAWEKPAH